MTTTTKAPKRAKRTARPRSVTTSIQLPQAVEFPTASPAWESPFAAEQAQHAAEVAALKSVDPEGPGAGPLAGLLLAGLHDGSEGDDPPLEVLIGARGDVRALETLLEAIGKGSDMDVGTFAAELRPLVTGIRRRLAVAIALYSRTYIRLETRPRLAASGAR
jgi:hypothetical protein